MSRKIESDKTRQLEERPTTPNVDDIPTMRIPIRDDETGRLDFIIPGEAQKIGFSVMSHGDDVILPLQTNIRGKENIPGGTFTAHNMTNVPKEHAVVDDTGLAADSSTNR